MARNVRSGLWLVIAGAAGAVFFAVTDARYGLAGRSAGPGLAIDLANQLWPGTLVGLAGSAAVLGVGLWLMTRRRG